MEERIERLQTLRFVAAGMVLLRHVLLELDHHGLLLGRIDWLIFPWGAGVDIFFVISGFIMTHISWEKAAEGASVGDFLVRRWIRLWPAYSIFSLLQVVTIVLIPTTLNHTGLDISYILASLVFVPWPRPGDGLYFPVLGQGWTLNYEMFFYLCFATALFLSRRKRLIALAGGFGSLVLLNNFWPFHHVGRFYANSIIFEFLFGVGIAAAFRAGARFRPNVAIFVAAMGVASLLALNTLIPTAPRFLTKGAPAALIVSAVLFGGSKAEVLLGRRPLAALGDASYALYLSHPFVINAFMLIALKLNFVFSWIVALISIGASIIFSLICCYFLERPIQRSALAYYNRLKT